MQHLVASRTGHHRHGADPAGADQHADHAAFLEDRRTALATAAALCTVVLVAGYFLMQGARHAALVADCAVPTQAACDTLALN